MGGSSGGKGKGGGKIKIPFYHISMQIGLCHSYGEAQLISFYAGDKLVSDVNISSITGERIFQEKLFGGSQKEGGLKGSLWYYTGLASQKLFGPHAARLGRTPDTAPGFRGIATVWLTGFHSNFRNEDWNMDNPRGFYVASSNPYIKPFRFRIRRKPVTTLDDATSMIQIQDRVNGQPMYAANPAHVLYEIYTNKAWGEGRSPATINTASFNAAASTLFAENFGISFSWLRQTTIEKVVQEIIDHIQAAIYDDPETGLLTIKLLRDDYVLSSLRELNPSNAKLQHFRRKLWGEVSSEVVVTWTNPEDEREMTVTAHNLSAAIAQNGNVVSTSRNFYMVRNPDLAIRLAERELKSLSYPLAALDAEVFREFSKAVPGDVVRVNWPDKDITDMPMRVMEIIDGGSQSDKITLKLQEDIFALPSTHYLKPVTTLWQPGVSGINPLFAAATLPGYVTAKTLGYNSVGDIPYPAAAAGFVARRDTTRDREYEVYGPFTLPNGSIKTELLTTLYYPPIYTTSVSMNRQVTTTLSNMALSVTTFPQVGDLVIIDNLGPTGELAVVEVANSSTRTITLLRGVLDTTPKVWPAGTRLYFYNPLENNIAEPHERASGENVAYRIDPMRTFSIFDASKPVPVNLNLTLTDRAHQPLRPANVKVNDVAFATATIAPATDIPVTWENRNRITESEQIMRWNDGNSSPESGQTTRVTLYTSGGAQFMQYSGLTGQSFTVPFADLEGRTSVIVGVSSERDGFVSFNEHRITLNVV